jgi:hypothetical protein
MVNFDSFHMFSPIVTKFGKKVYARLICFKVVSFFISFHFILIELRFSARHHIQDNRTSINDTLGNLNTLNALERTEQ